MSFSKRKKILFGNKGRVSLAQLVAAKSILLELWFSQSIDADVTDRSWMLPRSGLKSLPFY